MKKLLCILTLLLVLVCMLAACDVASNEDSDHTHDFGEWKETKAATCSEKGEEKRACACGETQKRELEMLEHYYGEWGEIKAATCIEKGEERRRCECGARETRESALGEHVTLFPVEENRVEPTHAAFGSYDSVRYCTVCGIEVERTTYEISNKGLHTYDEENICTVCSYYKDEGLVFELQDGTYTVNGYTGKEKEIIIPSKYKGLPVTAIASNAFKGYTALTSITIPESMKHIGETAFMRCVRLAEINFNAIAMEDLNFGVFDEAGRHSGGITVNIGANVTRVPAYLFASRYSTPISSVVPPFVRDVRFEENSVCTSIGEYAFYGCTKLYSIEFPIRLEEIGACAFFDCKGLDTINYNAVNYTSSNLRKSIFHGAGDDGGINLNIGANVKKFPAYFFYEDDFPLEYAPEFESVNFGQCESIGEYAFWCCSILTLTIPESVIDIGPMAFADCGWFSSVNFSKESRLKTIGERAFSNCYSLVTVEIPNGVENIESGAFLDCSFLKSITIPESVKSIGTGAFSGCTRMTEINFNAMAVEDLERFNHVFNRVGEAGEGVAVNIGANVTKIPNNLFVDQSKILEVNFASNGLCTGIGAHAFDGCASLVSVKLSANINSIGYSAFANCVSLTEITIPASVTFIDYYAFQNCISLTSVTFAETSGWWRASSSTATSGTAISATDLADPAKAAKCWQWIYVDDTWTRTEK